MSFPDENEEQNPETPIHQKIWPNSVYWGTSCGLLLYAISNDISVFAALQSYLKQIASSANDDMIMVLSFVAAILLLVMATAIFKYLFFGKNLWRMLTIAAVIVILHTTICFYGTFQRNETKNFEPSVVNIKPPTINAKPGNAKALKSFR